MLARFQTVPMPTVLSSVVFACLEYEADNCYAEHDKQDQHAEPEYQRQHQQHSIVCHGTPPCSQPVYPYGEGCQ